MKSFQEINNKGDIRLENILSAYTKTAHVYYINQKYFNPSVYRLGVK